MQIGQHPTSEIEGFPFSLAPGFKRVKKGVSAKKVSTVFAQPDTCHEKPLKRLPALRVT
jgi:hypothetical protein